MRFKQVIPVKARPSYRKYSVESLTEAYIAVKEGNMPVAKASRIYKVPMQTLRDRVLGKISIDTVTTGRAPAMNLEEEEKLVSRFQQLADIGYGYARSEVVNIGNDYAIQLGRRSKDNPLTVSWYVQFTKRWPEIEIFKKSSVEFKRDIRKSSEAVNSYFEQLKDIFSKYHLHDKPHLIFNVDEKDLCHNQTAAGYKRQKVLPGLKGKTKTIIGCGSASGMLIPPFFVFEGKKLTHGLMKGSTTGAKGVMSDNGLSNANIFREYLKEHFIKFVPERDPDQQLLLLLDGHTSHISPDLTEWANSNNIILFFLPAHTSDVLQPLDAECYGPFDRMFHDKCQTLKRKSSTPDRRLNICQLSCQVYEKALSKENLRSAFKKTGVYPLDKSVVSLVVETPAEESSVEKEVGGPVIFSAAEIPEQEPEMSPTTEELTSKLETKVGQRGESENKRKKKKPNRKVVRKKQITKKDDPEKDGTEKSKSAYCQYNKELLREAYIAVKEGKMPVAKASRIYKVPMQTLRDRVLGKISIDTVTTGKAPILSLEEQEKLLSHLQQLAKIGYVYTSSEIVNIGSDYAIQLGKRSKGNRLTVSWYVRFARRWPEIRLLQQNSLKFQKDTTKTSEYVNNYFGQLEDIFNKNNLHDKPHLIFNVDEKDLSLIHTKYECHQKIFPAQQGKTTTVIGCGSASGMLIPPFFVFEGKKLNPGLMKGSTTGAKGVMSDNGLSNANIFCKYLKEHFIKNIPERDPDQQLLLLLDGHTSHISPDLTEWANSNNIILFFLPAYTSNVLQPLEVGCYVPFDRMFHDEFQTPVSKFDICQLSCKVYERSLSRENLQSSFKKTGVYPLAKSVVRLDAAAPAEVPSVEQDVGDAVDSSPASSEQQLMSPTTEELTSRVEVQCGRKRQFEDNSKPQNNIWKVVPVKQITESDDGEEVCEQIAHSTLLLKRQKNGEPTAKKLKT